MSAEVTPARRVAFEVLRRTFEDGAWTDRAFTATALRAELGGRELAQSRRLAYGSVQRRATSDHLVALLAGRRGGRIDDAALAALRLGLYELLFSETAEHAAVDQAVELAKEGMRRSGGAHARARAASGFVNAILRRAAAERAELLASLDDSTPAGAAIAHSYPEWLAEMWWSELGAVEARLAMAAMNEPAEAAMRVNTLRAEPARVAADLRREGIEVRGPGSGGLLDPADGLVVDLASEPVGGLIATGELVPQSRGSQAVVALLDPQPGERVLDVCAGPGIKTTAIAARMENRGEVRSVELDPRRAAEIEALCGRAGATCVGVTVADATEGDLGSGYDRILLDPPCSDLGTLASRPDARWRKSPADIERLAALQRRLLVRAARALAPGGSLVYSTCTISRHENEELAGSLGEYARGLEADDLGAGERRLASRRDPRFLQLLPERDRTTGFFCARFRRAGRRSEAKPTRAAVEAPGSE
ncbi:MAG TPA: RsmB/NOP family class I SAM-dependent RNA methyltransferase [Solirubrobacterales bacterium]|nr:RsmB/NOP family class I SAM-dependent RNA methyltransferase [Solirubrobacterales bacterium]